MAANAPREEKIEGVVRGFLGATAVGMQIPEVNYNVPQQKCAASSTDLTDTTARVPDSISMLLQAGVPIPSVRLTQDLEWHTLSQSPLLEHHEDIKSSSLNFSLYLIC